MVAVGRSPAVVLLSCYSPRWAGPDPGCDGGALRSRAVSVPTLRGRAWTSPGLIGLTWPPEGENQSGHRGYGSGNHTADGGDKRSDIGEVSLIVDTGRALR